MNFPTLMDLANQVAYEGGEQSTHKVQLALYHLVQGVKRLTFDVFPQCRRAPLTVTANRTVRLPAEAVALSALYTEGGVPILADLVQLGTAAGGMVAAPTPAGGARTPAGPGRAYGFDAPATNTAGHYQGDPLTGLLTLSPDCPVQPGAGVIAVYTTSGIAATGETLAHPWSEQFLISYAQYKMMSPSRAIGLGEKQLKNEEWKSELRLTEKRFKRATKAEWLTALLGRQRRTL